MKKLILTVLLSLSFFVSNAETKFENRKMDYVVVPSFLLMKQFGVENDKILHYAVGYYATTLMQNHLEKWSNEHKWIKIVAPIVFLGVLTYANENTDKYFDKMDVVYTGIGCGAATFSYTFKF